MVGGEGDERGAEGRGSRVEDPAVRARVRVRVRSRVRIRIWMRARV